MDKRSILALGLIMAIILVFQMYIIPRESQKESAAVQTKPQAVTPTTAPKGDNNNNTKETKKESDTLIKDTLSPTLEKKINKQIFAETPYLKVALSDLGGGIAGVQLKKYKESVKGTKDKELIEDVKPYLYTPKGFQQLTKNSTADDSTYFKADRENITVTDKPERLVLSGAMDNGQKLRKYILFILIIT
jgi:YidC/Oxa1 family membrane protein insertase